VMLLTTGDCGRCEGWVWPDLGWCDSWPPMAGAARVSSGITVRSKIAQRTPRRGQFASVLLCPPPGTT
jgi:hypothetical protein